MCGLLGFNINNNKKQENCNFGFFNLGKKLFLRGLLFAHQYYIKRERRKYI